MESHEIRGNKLIGQVPGHVAANGDLVWSHGYTSRNENKVGRIEQGELSGCYFDPECHKLVDWDGVGELKMGVFGRLKTMKSVDEAKPMAAAVHGKLVSLGVPEDRADFVVNKWMKSVFKASLVYEIADPDPTSTGLYLDGFYFSFKTGGDPNQIVDRHEARQRGDIVTHYRSCPVGCTAPVDSVAALPAESFDIRGNVLVGVLPGHVESNGDIMWSNGYTSRKEHRTERTESGELEECYFDPECHKLVDWERVGELKLRVFGGRSKPMKNMGKTRPSRLHSRLESMRDPDERTDYIVTKWIESAFKDYEPSTPHASEFNLDGFYFTFKTGTKPSDVVDRFEQRTSGDRVFHYRNGPVGSTAHVTSASAKPMESYEIHGNRLIGEGKNPVQAYIDGNGDIVWSNGHTSRKESNSLFFVFFGLFLSASVLLERVYPYLPNCRRLLTTEKTWSSLHERRILQEEEQTTADSWDTDRQ
jgi:hypothetical protein